MRTKNAMGAWLHLCLMLLGASVSGTAWAQAGYVNEFDYQRTSSFTYYLATDGAKNGLLKSETIEPNNPQLCVTTTYTYDANGNKVGATTSTCSGATGRAVFTSRGSSSSYVGTSAQLITVNSSSVSVAVPSGIYPTTSTNALTQSETKTYDPRFGAVLSLVGPNQLTTRWEVDDFGRKTREVRADGTKTVIYHCVLATKPDGSSTGLDTSSNSAGCPTPVAGEAPADAVSFVHSEPRDASSSAGVKMGPFVRVYSDRLGREIRSVTEGFDGVGQPTALAGALIVKDTVYNESGAKFLETQPYFLSSGASTTTASNAVGVTMISYDALGRPLSVKVADANGKAGNATFGVDGGGTVSYGAYGTQAAAGTTYTYVGLTSTTVNDNGQSRSEQKNANGEVVLITDANGAGLAHLHDAFGNLIKTVDALQNTITLNYDIRGRKTRMVDPDSGTWNYDYDALGELVWQQSPNQALLKTQTTMAYDLIGRMISRVDPEYGSNWYYDAYADHSPCNKGVGKLCESTTTTLLDRKTVYDDFGRPINTRTSINGGPSMASALAYDGTTGRVVSQTYPTGLQVGYSYSSGTAKGFLEKLTLLTPATVNPLPATVGGPPGPSSNLPANTVLWQARVVNAWGRTEQQSFSNGVIASAGFEPATGRTKDLTAGVGGATTVVDQHYTWDSLNNLTGRVDNNGDTSSGVSTGAVTETFLYEDKLNRLTKYDVSAPQIPGLGRTVNLQYNALGMLLYKSDVGNYAYGAQNTAGVRPHALLSVTGSSTTTFGYDANGNVVSASAGKYSTVNYTSFNLPDSQSGIAGAGGTPRYTWQYDENHARIDEVRTIVGGTMAGTRTTWYLHPDNVGGLGFESEVNSPTSASAANPAVTSNRHYLSAGGQVIGVLVSTGDLPTLAAGQTAPAALTGVVLVKVEYWHKDHLGSIVSTTDHTGQLTAHYAYDPFGKRRYANGSYDEFGNVVVDWSPAVNAGTDRGFTGHEHLDDIGLVHMNGRIFDPTLGVFLQADPHLGSPENLQNYNRYGYCFNNPLTCTDPSGLDFWSEEKDFLVESWHDMWHDPLFRTALSIGAAAMAGPAAWAAGVDSELAQAAIAGFAGGAIASGDFKGGVRGAFTAALFFQAGDYLNSKGLFKNVNGGSPIGEWTVQGVALHGVVGCVSSVASGNKCGPGALSAAFSQATGRFKEDLNEIGGTLVSAAIGGTASAIGGGKFANGAITAAYGYLFNAMRHDAKTPGGYDGTGGEGIAVSAETYRTWGSYLPGTEAGDSAAQYWADRQVQTGNPLYAVPGVLASLWTPDTAVSTAFTLATAGGGSLLGEAAGPLKQWIRFGPSYSRAGGFSVDMSIRWGASPAGGGRYIQQIPSTILQEFNQWLRSLQVPVGGWRAADPGHFHLW